eukprot:6180463-Pleurochrysis_carterae.AAC.3
MTTRRAVGGGWRVLTRNDMGVDSGRLAAFGRAWTLLPAAQRHGATNFGRMPRNAPLILPGIHFVQCPAGCAK